MDEAVASTVSGAPPAPSPLPSGEKQATKKPRKSKSLVKSSPAKATSAIREPPSASLTHEFSKQSQPKGDNSTNLSSVPSSSSAFPANVDFNFSSLFASDSFQKGLMQAFKDAQRTYGSCVSAFNWFSFGFHI